MTPELKVQILVAVLFLVGVALSAVVGAWTASKRAPAQNASDQSVAANTVAQSVDLLIDHLNVEIVELRKDLTETKATVARMNGAYHILFELYVGENPTARVIKVTKAEPISALSQ